MKDQLGEYTTVHSFSYPLLLGEGGGSIPSNENTSRSTTISDSSGSTTRWDQARSEM